MTRRKIFVVNPDGERATAPRNDTLIVKVQPQGSQSRFETSGAVLIADKRIRYSQREGIERAADRNTRLPIASAAEILDGSQKSGRSNERIHGESCSNSSREIFRSRT